MILGSSPERLNPTREISLNNPVDVCRVYIYFTEALNQKSPSTNVDELSL
ncbi:hypothetical protein Q4Q35_17340 [Flavivirga aquimarina]|uniref:Uncharacterized protein n=1 Tax=Flavivirga aquimarina TaxID=2027862 RepID=A0ABT8WEK7_9FLAO|nr:hypothetical protein [Flavivirga aquimarina]MDO5971571.1 hypothetical protein [Flavivirga aquimarina]